MEEEVLLKLFKNLLQNINNVGSEETAKIYTSKYNSLLSELQSSTQDPFLMTIPVVDEPARYGDRHDKREEINLHLNQIISYIGAHVNDSDEEIKVLKDKIHSLESEKEAALRDKEDIMRITKEFQGARSYHVDPETLQLFTGNKLILMNEALMAYASGAYTACVCVCGNVLESIIQEKCKVYKIKEQGINKQITSLAKKVKNKEITSQLMRVAAFFRNRAAHPTTEVFTKEKANLILSTLFILVREDNK